MSFEFIIMAKNVVIAILFGILIYTFSRVRFLRRNLSEESRKRLIPVLVIEKVDNEYGFCIKNEGICSAKNICIDAFQLPLEYDFKRTVTIRFETIDILNPGQKEKLYFGAYDGGRHVGEQEMSYLLPKIDTANFEVRISYTNLEDVPFITIVGKEKNRFFVKYVGSQEKINRSA